MSKESYEHNPLRGAMITQGIHIVITFIFFGVITYRVFFELLPLSPESGLFFIPFVSMYFALGLIFLLLLLLWRRWLEKLGKHQRGLIYSSLILAITSLIPPLLFGFIPAVLVYLGSSRV
jgi:hypothetical protein